MLDTFKNHNTPPCATFEKKNCGTTKRQHINFQAHRLLMTMTLIMERDANGWGTSGGINHQTPQVDGRCDDLLILSRWVRKELFAQVKFLYNPEVDLRIRGRLFNTFLRDCKDRLVGLKLNANRNSDYKMMYAESLWTEATRKKRNLVADGLNARRSSIYSATQNRFNGKIKREGTPILL